MLSENELVDLCHKYQTHKLTESEFQLLQSWVNESEENLRFFSNYVKLYKSEKRIEANQHADAAKGWTIIERKLKQHRLRRKLYYAAIAACFFSFLLGTAVYLYTYQDSSLPAEEPSLAELFPNLPQNKVTLTLSSGQQIVLDEEQAKEIADNGKVVAQGSNNSLSYQPDNTPASSIQYNTITVPEGSTFSLTLSDGTQVTLNSTTTFRYPVSMQDKRIVELNGEAYFDVIHNEKQPFVVKTPQMDIQVLGTEFNVTAYSSSSDFEVALLRGCIELSSPRLSSNYRMKEKEHIRLQNNKLISKDISDYDYFRWKEGLICFNNESVATIIEKLKLYYDIDIEVYNQKFINSRYTGKFRTKDGIEQVLRVLQIEHKFTYTKNNDLNLITIK